MDVPWRTHEYDLKLYPFPELVAETLEEPDLTALTSDLPLHTWQTDQSTPWHAKFYRGFYVWRDVYEALVELVIAPLVGEPFYYQNVPSFRVHLPDNVAVGEFHTDAIYEHPAGEVTFWLPVTEAYGSCSVFIADDYDELFGVRASPGQLVEFSAVTRRHGNLVNRTGHSRVSFDFRCLPTRLLPDEPGETKHTKLKFAPGGYYATEVVR